MRSDRGREAAALQVLSCATGIRASGSRSRKTTPKARPLRAHCASVANCLRGARHLTVRCAVLTLWLPMPSRQVFTSAEATAVGVSACVGIELLLILPL